MRIPRTRHIANLIAALLMAALAVATTVASVLADGTGAPYPH
jgi:hypothetical protein